MSRRGNQAVELALLLPVLLAIVTGTFDYGWVILHQHVATTAANAGARAGAAAVDDEDPVALAEAAAEDRWEEVGLPAEVEVAAQSAAGQVVVAVQLGDIRLVKFVPGPSELVVIRSRSLEASP